jgi:hypothetical protein
MGIEPTTCGLGSYRSTTELRPRLRKEEIGNLRVALDAPVTVFRILMVRCGSVVCYRANRKLLVRQSKDYRSCRWDNRWKIRAG